MPAATAVILSACRTAIGSFGGALKDTAVSDLGAVVIREAIARAGVPAAAVDDVLMGCVLQAGAGMNVARQAAKKAGLPDDVPGDDDQPRVRFRSPGGGQRRTGDPRRRRDHRRGRRHGVDEQRRVPAEAGALGSAYGPWRACRQHDRRMA